MLDKLPFTHLKVGYQNVAVKLVERDILGGNYGHYCRKTNHIAIDADQNLPEAVNTLIHEVMHVLYKHFDLDAEIASKDRQEHDVTTLSNGLTQVLKDNPAFTKWIEESLADK